MVKWKKSLCVAMAAAMMMSCTACSNVNVKKEKIKVLSEDTTENVTDSDDGDDLKDTILSQLSVGENKVSDKDETVYVKSDANGKVENVIVSDWLKNSEGAATITDKTDLQDVENVKGDESYTENSDGTITWDANGKDIYYQGTSKEKLPVDVKVTYLLDGGEISPEELAGKSGRVTMRFEYTNNTKKTITVDGEDKEVVSPFVMISGMVLPVDKFTNVEVSNGKVISEGSNAMVVGMAVPGLMDCIKAGVTDSSINEAISRIDVPEYVEVTADVEDFSLAMTMSVGICDLLSSEGQIDLDALNLDSVTDKVDVMTDSADKLESGSADLKNGLETLKDGTYSLKTGGDTLMAGIDSLKEYTSQLASGTTKLEGAISSLSGGITSVKNGAQALSTGADALDAGAAGLASGVDKVYTAETDLVTGAKKLQAGYAGTSETKGAKDGIKEVAAGATAVKGGINTLLTLLNGIPASIRANESGILAQAGCSSVAELDGKITALSQVLLTESGNTAETLNNYTALVQAKSAIGTMESVAGNLETQMASNATDINALTTGASALEAGSASLKTGIDTLAAGTDTLTAGLEKLQSGTGDLKDGADAVAAGADKISTNLTTLYAGSKTLAAGGSQLLSAANTLNSGATSIHTGVVTLSSGTKTFVDGVGTLDSGAQELLDGSSTLSDGMTKFNEEAIKKVASLFGGNYKKEVDFIEAVFEEGTAYSTYSGVADGKTGTVKFIYETESIE